MAWFRLLGKVGPLCPIYIYHQSLKDLIGMSLNFRWLLRIKLGWTYFTVSEGRSPYPLVPKVILDQLNSRTDLRVIPFGIILRENHPVPYINLFLETRTKVEWFEWIGNFPYRLVPICFPHVFEHLVFRQWCCWVNTSLNRRISND